MPPDSVATTIDLAPGRYQQTLEAFRLMLEGGGKGFLDIGVRTPRGETVNLQVRRMNAYVVGFKGADGWYSFRGEHDGRGVSCGIGSNYNELGFVGNVTYDDLNALAALGRFARGAALDKRLVAIIIAITSEAARFAAVATWFVGLTNSVGTQHAGWLPKSVDFEHLKHTYFTQWANPPEPDMKPGQVYHYVGSSGILLPHRK